MAIKGIDHTYIVTENGREVKAPVITINDFLDEFLGEGDWYLGSAYTLENFGCWDIVHDSDADSISEYRAKYGDNPIVQIFIDDGVVEAYVFDARDNRAFV